MPLDVPDRSRSREFGGAGLIATEMVNAKGFVWMDKEQQEFPDNCPCEVGFIFQLLAAAGRLQGTPFPPTGLCDEDLYDADGTLVDTLESPVVANEADALAVLECCAFAQLVGPSITTSQCEDPGDFKNFLGSEAEYDFQFGLP